MRSRPLDGIRVTDFSWIGAGSFTTRLLADHGADVIKIESMARPDQTRLTPPFANRKAGINRSGYFADRNTGKRSIALNVKTPQGREIALALYGKSDIVANNFRPGTLDRLGLGYQEAVKQRPDIIFCEMSMQGATGPDRDRIGYGLTISAVTGLHGLSGIPGREPIGTGTNYPDHVPSPGHAVVAILAALLHRDRTGAGQYIDIAQTEATISVLGVPAVQYLMTGEIPGPAKNASPAIAWQDVLPCRGEDRWIAVSVTGDEEWEALWHTVTGSPPPVGLDRVEAETASRELGEFTRREDPWSLMDRLQSAGVAAGVVQHAGDLVDRDPQLAARRHFVTLPHAEMGDMRYSAFPFRLSRTPCPPQSAAPRFGEHTFEVLGEVLGMDERECARLVDEGVLA